MFTQWFIKTFRKSSAVRCLIVLEDQRVIVRWAIPKLTTEDLDIKGIGVFKMTRENMYLTIKNVPTYFFDIKNCAPINLETGEHSEILPEEYKTALNTKAWKEALESSKGGGAISTETMIIIAVMVIGFMAMWYMNKQETDSIRATLEALGIGG